MTPEHGCRNTDNDGARWEWFPTSSLTSPEPSTENASLSTSGRKRATRPSTRTGEVHGGSHQRSPNARGSAARSCPPEKRWRRRFGGKPCGGCSGSHDAADHLGERCYASGCREDVAEIHTPCCLRTEWASTTYTNQTHTHHVVARTPRKKCRNPVSIKGTTKPRFEKFRARATRDPSARNY